MENNNLFLNASCRALIIGSSGAIGGALVDNLKKIVGTKNVVTLSRTENGLDFMKPETISVCSRQQDGLFNLIVDATGSLSIDNVGPEKSLSMVEYETMLAQFKVNTIGPALLIKNFMKFLPRKGKVVFATLSARVGSIEDNRLGGWISYRASKAGLNQIIKTASIEASRKNPHSVFLAIHPGTVLSKLTEPYLGNKSFVVPDEAAKNILRVIEQIDHSDTGGFFSFDGSKVPY